MAVVVNEGTEFPGAASRIEPPIGEPECSNTPAFEDLCLHEHKADRGVTIRSGKAWARRPPAEIDVMCDLAVPTITTVTPASEASPLERVLAVTNAGAVPWKVWASQFNTWAAAVDKIEQVVTLWADDGITLTVDVQCNGTGEWFLYVMNEAQFVNADGKTFDVTVCN